MEELYYVVGLFKGTRHYVSMKGGVPVLVTDETEAIRFRRDSAIAACMALPSRFRISDPQIVNINGAG
jgi:hypothetical protein